MCGTLRLYLVVFLLSCSLRMPASAQDPHSESPAEKHKETERFQREKSVDEMAKRKGISRDEAEREISEAQKAFENSKADLAKSHKGNAKPTPVAVPFNPAKSKVTTKIDLKDADSSAHPKDWIGTLTNTHERPPVKSGGAAAKSEGGDAVTNKPNSKAGNKKTPASTNSHEDSDAQPEHHGHLICEGLQGVSRDKCLEELKKVSTGPN